MFLSRKCANTRSTKALRDNFALAESQPTSGTLQLSLSWRSTLHPVYQSFLVLNFGTGTHAVSEVSFILEEFEFCRRSWILFDCRHFMGGEYDPIEARPLGCQTEGIRGERIL